MIRSLTLQKQEKIEKSKGRNVEGKSNRSVERQGGEENAVPNAMCRRSRKIVLFR
jgi:hypothetical protein